MMAKTCMFARLSMMAGLVSAAAWQNAFAQGVRDSAGVRIVENARPVWAPAEALRLSSSPSLVIGTRAEPSYELSRVAGATRLSDGRIAIADGGSLELRFFDSEGTFSNAVGGRGEGPGEFRRIDSFHRLRGDTLAVLSQLRIVSLFTGRGEFVRRVTVVPIPGGPRAEIQMVGAILTPETFLTASLAPTRDARGERWVDSARLELLSRDTVRRGLGTFPSMLMVKDNPSPRPPWFAPHAVFASDGSAIFVGYGAEYSIQVYSSAGRLERIIRRRWTPVRVTRQDIESYVTEWAKRWIRTRGAEAETQRQDLRDDPYADEVPAFSQFIVDRTGRLWVREAHVADAPVAGALNTSPLVPSVWSVFDRSGLWLGDVTMPARFMPSDIGPDYVLGVARDDDDVQTVVQYRLGSGAQVRQAIRVAERLALRLAPARREQARRYLQASARPGF